MPESTPETLPPDLLPIDTVRHVAGTCLCLHAQRAARALARRFDAALRPFGLTNGQFSLMVALNQPEPPTIGQLAPFLAMDRTTLTAALKPLEGRGWVRVLPDPADRRSRRVAITPAAAAVLRAALPVWRAEHARLDAAIAPADPAQLRAGLNGLARAPLSPPGA